MIASIFWNSTEGRVRSFWRLLVGLASIFAILLGIVLAAQIVRHVLELSGSVAASQGQYSKYIQIIIGVLAMAVAVSSVSFLVGRFLDKRGWIGFGFFRARLWQDGLAGLLLGALLMLLIFMLELGLDWLVWQWNPMQFSTLLIFQISGLLVFLLVGYYEELLARGFLLLNLAEGLGAQSQNTGRNRLAAWGALLISALIFSLIHSGNPGMNWVSYTGLFLAGIFLGLPYMLTGRLWFSIGLHWSWNFVQGFVFGFPVSGNPVEGSWILSSSTGPVAWTGGKFGPEAGLLGFGAIVLGTLLLLIYVRLVYGSIAFRMPYYQPQKRAAEAPLTGSDIAG